MIETMGDEVQVSGAPDVPGLRFRRLGDGDFEALADLLNRCWAFDGLTERTTAADEANELAHLNGFDRTRDALVGDLEGHLVAHARTNREIRADGVVLLRHHCAVDPSLRRRGIGRALLQHGRDRLREATLALDPAGAPRVYAAWCAEGEAGDVALLTAEGYAPVRAFFEMERPMLDNLPDLSLPAGIEVRPLTDRATAQRVLDAADEAFRDHWGHRDATESDVLAILDGPHTDLSLWQVAWAGVEIAGIVQPSIHAEENAAIGRHRGWLDSVAVRRPWRGRGLASALMVRGMHALRERGMTSAGLGVDSENPTGALRIYERLGFEVTQRFLVFRRPFET